MHFPWGALLDAVVGARADVLAAVARAMKPGGSLDLLVSTTERDGRSPLTVRQFEDLRDAYAAAGLRISDVRCAAWSDVQAAHSSWGKRLDAGRSRPAFVVRCRREAATVVAAAEE